MAIKGAIAKEEVTQKILEAFPNAFRYDKELRIPVMENGEMLQIKCALTCAKIAVEPNSDTAIPGATPKAATASAPMWNFEEPDTKAATQPAPPEPSADEKQNIATLLQKLGF